MASNKEYLDFVLEQLSELEEIAYRAMMGEYIIYYRGKIVGGIYDDRLLVKPVKSAVSLMPTATYELPYDGAKEMLLVENIDNKEFLTALFHAMYDELPAPKRKKKEENVMGALDNSEFEKHKAEAQAKWGKTDAYKEHAEKTKDYSKQKWNDLAAEMDCIMAEFALCLRNGEAPDSRDAQNLVKMLQNHITENYYHCTNEILAGLGQMYVADVRFKKNIDQHADGTAEFIRDAIDIYCGK